MEALLGAAQTAAGVPGLGKILEVTIQEAVTLFKLYRNREGDRKSFALYMNNVAKTLKGVKASVPPHAEPVVRELAALIATARTKVNKYEARGFTSSMLHLHSEAEKLQSIMRGVQQLLPLLTVSVASGANVSEAVSDLQRRAGALQNSSTETAAHLSHMAAAVEALSTSSASAAQVEQSIAALHGSMMKLHEEGVEIVLKGCAAVQEQLVHGLDHLLEVVDMMQISFENFSTQMLALQREIRKDVNQIMACLEKHFGEGSGAAQGIQPGRILAAMDEVIEDGGRLPDSNEEWAAAIRDAILAGKLSITSCLVLGVPLTPEGPLRPVALPCCGFVVSHAGGQRLKEQPEAKCHICKVPIAADAELQGSDSVAAAVAAENRGFAPRIVQSSEVTIDTSAKIHLGSGGEGTVVKGTFRGRAVAVKQVPVPAAVGPKEIASVKHVVSASYIAGVASPYVCKLFGYCWTDSHLWLLLELCEGSLSELVPRAKQLCDLPGLPPVDTVALGLMLCSALDAVHRSARCLHLDLTPGNVLLAAPTSKEDREAGHGPHSVRLSDFGLSKHLPSCVATTLATAAPQSLVQGVAMGTPGYAPREQLQTTAQRRSDVYSLGATLLYAATGVHPFQGGDLQSIMLKLLAGTPMQVPEYVQPPPLRALLSVMTAVEASARPHLPEVQQRLLSMYDALRAEGAAHQFITPAAHAIVPTASERKAHEKPRTADHERTSGLANTDRIKGSSDSDETPDAALASLQLQSAPESRQGTAQEPSPGQGGPSFQAAVAATERGDTAASSGKPPATAAHVSPDRRTDDSTNSPAMPGGGKFADVSGIHTVEQLCDHMEAAAEALAYDFRGRTLRPKSAIKKFFGVKLPDPKTVLLTQGRGIVTNVCLDLSHPGAKYRGVWLVLRGTSQVEFRDVTVKGGTLACADPQCRVVLTNVDLRSCQLRAQDGATVSADGGRWEMQEGSRSAERVKDACWIVCDVHGAGTTVSASRTTMDGRVRVYKGASLTAEAVQVRLQSRLDNELGVFAGGDGTRVTLRDAAVVYHGSRPEEEVLQIGVAVVGKAVLDMAGGSVRQVALGVAVCGGGHARMRDCTVDAAWDGVCVFGADTRVHAVGCRISGGTASVATDTDVTRSNIAFENCEVGKWRTL